MSQITLQGDVSGTGVFTLAAPNSNTSRTLNLPDAGGAMVLDTATQTLTNKTLTSPTLVTPALGTPSSGNLANCTFPTLNQNTTGSSGSTTGNAATATTLQTARTIGGVSFNGAANINLPGVDTGGNQNTTGSAASLTTARAINGVNFNGTAPITVTAVTPNALTISTGLSGTSYNGSAAVTVAIDSTVATLTGTQTLTNKTINSAILNDGYTEEVFAITDGTTVNLNPNNGSIQTWTLGANRTPGQANWAAGQSITLMIDDGSAFTITWSTLGVVWKTNTGSAPTLQTSGFTVITLWKVGTTIYGARVGDA